MHCRVIGVEINNIPKIFVKHPTGGHTTKAPATITYASVVSRESVRIALLLAALNNVEVKTEDIENA